MTYFTSLNMILAIMRMTTYACDLGLKSLMDKLECASDIALD